MNNKTGLLVAVLVLTVVIAFAVSTRYQISPVATGPGLWVLDTWTGSARFCVTTTRDCREMKNRTAEELASARRAADEFLDSESE